MINRKNTRRMWAWIILCLLCFLGYWVSVAFRDLDKRIRQQECVISLKMIQGAKEQWASDHQKGTNDFATWSDLAGSDGYFKNRPGCVSGGTYFLRTVGQLPVCSYTDPKHSHVLYKDTNGNYYRR
jgi:hypothetical protein